MRFIKRSALLALMAVCALGAVAATSALAVEVRPEFKPASGAKFPIAFSGKSGEMLFELPGTKAIYACKSSTISGEILGPKELGKVKLQFSEGTCAVDWGAGFCWSETPHTWGTNELIGRLGYRSKSAKSVGLVFEAGSGPFALCGDKEFPGDEILGSVLSPVNPVNKETTKFTLTTKDASGEKLEGESTAPKLERKMGKNNPEVAVMKDEFEITTSQKVELRA
jgi:hypothetical protein